jgi:integrase
MARRSSPGGIVTAQTKTRGTSYGARFRAFGKRQFVHLGYSSEGYDMAQAEHELAFITEQVARGLWQPPAEPEAQREMPTFHEFASAWFEARKLEGGRSGRGLSPSGEADLRWRLSNHLLPVLARKRLDQISVADVDSFRRAKLREGLNATSANKLLATLAAILDEAVDHEHIAKNPARGKRRRLPAAKPRRTLIDRAEAIRALLDAASEIDSERRGSYRRALISTLVFLGLRIGEALALRWRDVDLANGRIRVRGTKTDAAQRSVDMLPALRDDLGEHAASRPSDDPNAYVFATATGRAFGYTNIRRGALSPAIERANERLAEQGSEPLPEGLSPHSMRRTFASLLYALGETPPYVMAQMGHTSPNLALAIYARCMDCRDGEPERLKALVKGEGWALAGNSAAEAASESPAPGASESEDLAA